MRKKELVNKSDKEQKIHVLQRRSSQRERGIGTRNDHLGSTFGKIVAEGSPEGFVSILSTPEVSHPVNTSQKVNIINHLHEFYGNQYVLRAIQTKLKFRQPGDIYEQEADRIAKMAVSSQDPVARKEGMIHEEEEVQDLVLSAPSKRTSSILKKGYQFEEDMTRRILRKKGLGKSLDPSIKLEMESSFGQDFSNVKVYSDTQVSEIAEYFQANAFTIGSDIFFPLGKYNPSSKAGRKLIAHELTHVIQQGKSANMDAKRDTYEIGAEKNADSISRHNGISSLTIPDSNISSALAIQFDSYLGTFFIFSALYLDPEVVSDIVDVLNIGAGAAGIVAVLSAAGIITAELAIPAGLIAGLLVVGAGVLNLMSRHGNGIVVVHIPFLPPPSLQVFPRSLVE